MQFLPRGRPSVRLSDRPSVMLVNCDHICWNSSEIISPLVSLGCSLSADPNIRGLLQREHPEILAQSDPPPVDLSVGDIRSEIAAEWLQIAHGEPIGNHHRSFEWCHSYDLPFPPKWEFYMPPRYANGHISATGDPIHFMFGSRVGLCRKSRRYFRLHQIQVGGRPPSWTISNGHISATAHSIHLYSAHRAVFFAIAQLSCNTWTLDD